MRKRRVPHQLGAGHRCVRTPCRPLQWSTNWVTSSSALVVPSTTSSLVVMIQSATCHCDRIQCVGRHYPTEAVSSNSRQQPYGPSGPSGPYTLSNSRECFYRIIGKVTRTFKKLIFFTVFQSFLSWEESDRNMWKARVSLLKLLTVCCAFISSCVKTSPPCGHFSKFKSLLDCRLFSVLHMCVCVCDCDVIDCVLVFLKT